MIRVIAMKSIDGFVCGMFVCDIGVGIFVFVGDVIKGYVFNVIGDCLNFKEGEKLEIIECWFIYCKVLVFD